MQNMWEDERMKWIDIMDRLPDVGNCKPPELAWLVTDGKRISLETMHPSYWNGSFGPDDMHDGPIVTHWMPLPELPHELGVNTVFHVEQLN